MTAPFAAVIIRKEREVIAAFRNAGATSPARALEIGALSIDEGIGFRRLARHAVIREGCPGAFYLDEEVLAAVRATRRRIALVLLGVIVIVALGVSFGGVTLR